jgi:Fe-S-cluster containining protein
MLDNQADCCCACGACCSFDSRWPTFTTDSDADIAAIPPAYVNADNTGMHCNGNRCSALEGTVGTETTCAAYAVRPDVCRACEPGNPECNLARQAFGLPALTF